MPISWLRQLATRSMLMAGWARMNKNGSPGVDGVSMQSFSKRLDAELATLQHEVLSGIYRPLPLLSVWIKRPGKKHRELGIPAVRDRVLQSACSLLIGPTLEANFEDCSFAYRQGRSVRQAISRVERLRDEGFRWVVDADINRFFEEIPHEPLLRELSILIPDSDLIALVRQWLTCSIRRGKIDVPRNRGIAQGSPLSPMLANLYLDQLDEAILEKNLRLVRFADDFLILCRHPEHAEQALEVTRTILDGLELSLHAEKTRVAHFDHGFRFLGTLFIRSLSMPSKNPIEPETAVFDGAFNQQHVDSHACLPVETASPVTRLQTEWKETSPQGTPLADAMNDALEKQPGWRPENESTKVTTSQSANDTAAILPGLDDPPLVAIFPDSATAAVCANPKTMEAFFDEDPLLFADISAQENPVCQEPALAGNSLMQTLYVTEPGSEIAREGERFLVRKSNSILIELPALKVDLICLFGRIHITTAAMQLALLRGIPIALIGRNGRYYGRIEPSHAGNVKLQHAQFFAAEDETFRLAIAQCFIRGKLDNAAIVLWRIARTHGHAVKSAIPRLRQFSDQIKTVKSLEELNGLEGAAANSYFEAWRTVLPAALAFTRRQSRPAPDAVNALLSLGYTILYQNVAAILAARGLNAHVGIMHVPGGNHLALASDVMEEFRPPLVDSVVMNLLLNKHLPDPIATTRDQGVVLSPPTVRVFLAAFENRLSQHAQYLGGETTTDWRRLIDLQVRRIVQAIRTRDPHLYNPIRMR